MDSEIWMYIAGFFAALLLFGGFLYWLLRVQASMGLASDGPVPERTKRPQSYETTSAYPMAPASSVVIQAVQPATPTGPPVLPFKTVMQYVGERCIHLLIVGETHSGKSTSARAVLAGRIQAGDQIAILDPHGNPTNWGGIRAIGAGRDFAAIEQAMVELLAEMTRRYKLLAEDANYQPTSLSIFVDEWPAIQTACKKTAAQFITELAQEGRKVGLRLVMLTQSDLVASLGIEGKGDIRSNFTMLLLGSKASARADMSALTWPAALRKGEGIAYPAITDPMPSYEALLNTIAANIWQPTNRQQIVNKPPAESPVKAAPVVSDVEPNLDPLWAKFLNGESLLEPESVTSNKSAIGVEKPEKSTSLPVTENAVLPDTEAVRTSTADMPQDDLSKIIRLLVNGGISRNKVMQFVTIPGTRNDQLKRIKEALGESEMGV